MRAASPLANSRLIQADIPCISLLRIPLKCTLTCDAQGFARCCPPARGTAREIPNEGSFSRQTQQYARVAGTPSRLAPGENKSDRIRKYLPSLSRREWR